MLGLCTRGCHAHQIALDSHAAIIIYFGINIVLLAMSLQAHLYHVLVHPPYLQLQSLTRDIFS